ncbi:Protein F32H2.11 [Aphelenchoides avenae]|nr:Protein F32H2.11 [Aphelenchus avenae]
MLYWRRPFRLWILTATVLLVLVIVSVVVHVPITIEWSARDKNAVVIDKPGQLEDYRLAHDSVKCYCDHHQYPFYLIVLEGNGTLASACPQEDFMFRRHCVVAHFLERHQQDIEWLLFLDADMGVINPNHTIEEFVNGSFDMIFYERSFNDEIMAGSYIARNTAYARSFLMDWAHYYYKTPQSFHGTDNGAIHSLFLDKFCAGCSLKAAECLKIWAGSKNYGDLSLYTSCVRAVLGLRNNFDDKVLLRTGYANGGYWARDGWLTGSEWAPSDFILHGWQMHKLDWPRTNFAWWQTPFTKHDFDFPKCTTDAAYENWSYNGTFMRDDRHIHAAMEKISRKTFLEHLKRLERLA